MRECLCEKWKAGGGVCVCLCDLYLEKEELLLVMFKGENMTLCMNVIPGYFALKQ